MNVNVPVDVSIIIPVYNEESNIVELFQQLSRALNPSGYSFEMIFIDDGSTDASADILARLRREHPGVIKLLRFSRNFGHQIAIIAGLKYAGGKTAVVTDADLQDPPEVILQFLSRWKEGYDIVYGVRSRRQGETFFKRFSAEFFYWIFRKLTNIDIPANVGDFYLLDRKAIDAFNAISERHRFNRGLVAWLGFKRWGEPYERRARHAGTSKYSFWKMVALAMDAIVAFSFAPLRFVFFSGAFLSAAAFVFITVIAWLKFFTHTAIDGWIWLMAVILFIGGVQLLAVGITGEYLARIGDETKSRPLYIVKEFLE